MKNEKIKPICTKTGGDCLNQPLKNTIDHIRLLAKQLRDGITPDTSEQGKNEALKTAAQYDALADEYQFQLNAQKCGACWNATS